MVRYCVVTAAVLMTLSGCERTREAPAPAAAPLAAGCPADLAADRLILARRAGMHMSATLLNRGFKDTLAAGGDVRTQVPGAEGLAAWAGGIAGLFPRCTASGKTRAGPRIWTDKAGFEEKAAGLAAAATRLAELAAAGDQSGFAAQVEIVQQSCAACHSAYRRQDFPAS